MTAARLIKKRILIIGSNGMLGQQLTEDYQSREDVEMLCASGKNESVFKDVSYVSLDITKKNQVKKVILDFFPDVIINTASYNNVDLSETERETAWNINVKGVENVALYAWTIDAFLIQISSDYIFDGTAGPYTEVDKPNPISYYGRTKLAGENVLAANGVRHSIVRTNVLYGPTLFGRHDFVRWVIDSLLAGKNIRIVTDQKNNPAFIEDLSRGIMKIAEHEKEEIYNIAGAEFLSRFDFTNRIADYFGLDKNLISPIKTEELKQPARRPLQSGLVTLKAQTEVGYEATPLEETFSIISKKLGL